MIISNNVLQQIEPFHVYCHLPEENVSQPLSFVLGSAGPHTAAVSEGALNKCPSHTHPQGILVEFWRTYGGKHAYKKGRGVISLWPGVCSVYTVHVYIVCHCPVGTFQWSFFLLEFSKSLKQKGKPTEHKGLIRVHWKSEQPHCVLTLLWLANCLQQHWYWSNNRQAMSGCDVPLKSFRLWPFFPWELTADHFQHTRLVTVAQRIDKKMEVWWLDYRVACVLVFHTIKYLAPALALQAWLNPWRRGNAGF